MAFISAIGNSNRSNSLVDCDGGPSAGLNGHGLSIDARYALTDIVHEKTHVIWYPLLLMLNGPSRVGVLLCRRCVVFEGPVTITRK
jgi:hypothetical protein